MTRALAALGVVIAHALGQSRLLRPEAFAGGVMGVEFFFVLSGFIIYHVHWRDIGRPERFGPYVFKRFSRLYPVYWVLAFVLIPLVLLVPSAAESGGKMDPWMLLNSLTLLPMKQVPFLGVTWSLQYEIVFYTLFGLVILNARLRWLTWVWAIAVIVALPGGPRTDFPASFVLNVLNLNFLAGVLAAIASRIYGSPVIARGVLLAGLILLILVGCLRLFTTSLSPTEGQLLYGFASALLVYGLTVMETAGKIRVPRALVFLGDASYAIYLVHYPAEAVVRKIMGYGSASFVAMTVLGITAGALLHLLVERPVGDALRLRTEQKPKTA